jgi:hypothetical protein
MSKSRRVSLSPCPGQSGYRLRRRKRGWATPCPAGGAPYMGGKSARQWLFSAIFRRSGPDEPAARGRRRKGSGRKRPHPIEPR